MDKKHGNNLDPEANAIVVSVVRVCFESSIKKELGSLCSPISTRRLLSPCSMLWLPILVPLISSQRLGQFLLVFYRQSPDYPTFSQSVLKNQSYDPLISPYELSRQPMHFLISVPLAILVTVVGSNY